MKEGSSKSSTGRGGCGSILCGVLPPETHPASRQTIDAAADSAEAGWSAARHTTLCWLYCLLICHPAAPSPVKKKLCYFTADFVTAAPATPSNTAATPTTTTITSATVVPSHRYTTNKSTNNFDIILN